MDAAAKTPMSSAEQYARDIDSGKIVSGRLMKLAAKRFLSDLQRTDIYFDEDEANKFMFFAHNHCNQWEDAWQGQPIVFQPWQYFIFQQLFGWIKVKTGTRRFTKFYLQISKKNGKSTMCAILAIFHLFADERVKTPKVFTAANNEEQAKICVNMAGKIIQWSPDLNEYVEEGEVKLSTYNKEITDVIHKGRDGFITALSKEASDKKSKTSGGKHGINASLGLVDEFGMSPDQGASGTIYSSMAARLERLMAYLTTAGFNMQGPCFRELREQGIQCLEGVLIMDNYLPIIYEMDKPIGEDGKAKDITLQYLKAHEELWYQSNPNLDISVQRDHLREMLDNAINLGGTTEVETKTLNFNIWCEAPEVWVSRETWEKNTHGITEQELEGVQCYGAIHIISQKELGVFTLLFPNVRKDVHVVMPLFWMPSKYIFDNNSQTDFLSWVNQKKIITCEGNAVDNLFIFDRIWEEISKYQLHSVAFPTNMEKHDIVQALILNEIECNPISQGYRGNSEPTFAWEALLTAGNIEHFGNPVLAWSNSQCMVKRMGDDVKVERAGARTAGIVSCINALAQWKTVEAEGEEEAGVDFVNL